MAVCVAGIGLATRAAMQPPPERLDPPPGEVARAAVFDRRGVPLAVTYENRWNVYDRVPLHRVPPLLRDAVVFAEDARFHEHAGVDWRARAAAAWQNLLAMRVVRGASTISEQAVRMLHPRPRTFWARWVEGFEAMALERRFSKGEILSFYLNQVPYARQRRGVVQAAHDLFDRDLDTLSRDEMLALAVLLRSPSGLDPRNAPGALDGRMRALARRLAEAGRIPEDAAATVAAHPLELASSRLPLAAPGFVRHVRERAGDRARIVTPLDAELQARLQPILDERVAHLAERGVRHGALLVVDHRRNEVVVWANATSDSTIDAVVTPRQPGSTLKPFVYAMALERGWTAATLIDDSPVAVAVGSGLHRYRNYSRTYHGPLRLRLALANSLNVPAVRTVRSLAPGAFHRRLRELGFASLDRHPDFYGDGLVLGNGEVTLLELVSAYAALARGGVRAPIRVTEREAAGPAVRVFDADAVSLVADILSDADAREMEFGRGGVLDFPVPTAVKTGTSNDHRDAWAVGFSSRYTAGVWMGDLDRRAMKDVTGAVGPAVVLRAVFAELHRFDPAGPLPLSRRLRRVEICAVSGARPGAFCPVVQEWFRPDRAPRHDCPLHGEAATAATAAGESASIDIVSPTSGLRLAMDPRIPDELEVFEFALSGRPGTDDVVWLVDGEPQRLARSAGDRWAWPLARGRHRVSARVGSGPGARQTREVRFVVR
jgi:penicillin-binding protein 1C